MKTYQCHKRVKASQTDMLATDWQVVEEAG